MTLKHIKFELFGFRFFCYRVTFVFKFSRCQEKNVQKVIDPENITKSDISIYHYR